jgi:exo-1,4-beta-D-glucosaminidase
MKGLASMARVPVTATATTRASDGTSTTTVTLRHGGSGKTPALLTDVHLVDGRGEPVLPVRWSDNEVSLWPGESVTLTATYRTADLHGSAPGVRVSGWNTPEHTVPAA